jgi:hypothetical protein
MVCSITHSPSLSFVTVNFCEVEVPTLYDTEAKCNLISEANFVSLPSECVIYRKFQSTGARTLSGSLRIKGEAVLQLSIFGSSFTDTFLLVPNLYYPLLIARPFIKETDLLFDPTTKEFWLKSTCSHAPRPGYPKIPVVSACFPKDVRAALVLEPTF